MDLERVRSYLQAACAGLGFDIGEIWWSSHESGTSSLASIEEKKDDGGGGAIIGVGRTKRFVQLYTSKRYEDFRSTLISPDADSSEGDNSELSLVSTRNPPRRDDSSLQKHVLSPRLVDAISSNTQVLWANTQKREGLLGRSDLPLQTAVGMPVAVDGDGNMCVVVMFSPSNLESSDEAMDFLQFISRSATSSSIPCLLPVFNESCHMHAPLLLNHKPTPHESFVSNLLVSSLPEGVSAHFLSFDDNHHPHIDQYGKANAASGNRELATAPRDCFGIPMLPESSELGKTLLEENPAGSVNACAEDAFDEASFGIWKTIMRSSTDTFETTATHSQDTHQPTQISIGSLQHSPSLSSIESSSSSVLSATKPILPPNQLARLEEFVTAFLGMSVFDAADIWIPGCGKTADKLHFVSFIASRVKNQELNAFGISSEDATIQQWSGAVGRAFASANPVWSHDMEVIVDSERFEAFRRTDIKTALAVPIYSNGAVSPSCVLCFYSLVKADSVPCLLRFVQQALRLLWEGLDNVEPHVSVGKEIWEGVAPADLGEMAADLEMQEEFMRKKRPRSLMAPGQDLGNAGVESQFPLHVSITNKQDAGISGVESRPLKQLGSAHESSLCAPSIPIPIASVGGTRVLETASSSISEQTIPTITTMTNTSPVVRSEGPVAAATKLGMKMYSAGYAVNWVYTNTATTESGIKRARVANPTKQPASVEGAQSSTPTPSSVMAPNQPIPPPQPLVNHFAASTGTIQASMSHRSITSDKKPQANETPPASSAGQAAPPSSQLIDVQNQGKPLVTAAAAVTSPSAQGWIEDSMSHTHTAQQSNMSIYQPLNPPALQTLHPASHLQSNESGQSPAPCEQQVVSTTVLPTFHGNLHNDFLHQGPIPINTQISSPTNIFTFQSPSNGQLSNSTNSSATLQNFQSSGPGQHDTSASTSFPQGLHQKVKAGQAAFFVRQPPPIAPAVVYNAGAMAKNGSVLLPAPGSVVPETSPTVKSQVDSSSLSKLQYCVPSTVTAVCSVLPEVKTCGIQGCNVPAESRRPYCSRHSGNRLCEHEGCSKCAQGPTRFCIAHGGGRRCTYPGCDKGARDKFFCAAHGGGKRCQFMGCTKSAVGGCDLCTSHGGGRRCAISGCDKSAQSSTKFCVKHGGGKKCAKVGCEKVARGRTHFCAAHGGGVRCKLNGCNRVAIGKLQLCRAHGGGARSNQQNVAGGSSSAVTEPHGMMEQQPMQPNGITHHI